MELYTAVEVLTGSMLGVRWSPWLFALQDSEVTERIDRLVLGARMPGRPMTADVCQSRCARTLTHLQNNDLWATAARVESKRTKTDSPGLSLCSRSIGPRLVEEGSNEAYRHSLRTLPVGLLETHLLCYVVIRADSAYKCVGILRLDQDENSQRLFYISRVHEKQLQ